jgi:hypothetical protein
MAQSLNIFISYRRADSASISGRIYDRLVAKYGRSNVFKDVDNIPPGVRFGTYIQNSLRQCAVALVVIGPRWLDVPTADGRRRLDDPTDWVRIEVETALALGLTVIPVLVEGALMPKAAELPVSLQVLAQINSIVVRYDPDFAHDMERLIAGLERLLANAAPGPAIPFAREQAAQISDQPAVAGALVFWGLAFGVPLAAVAGGDAILSTNVNYDLFFNQGQLTPGLNTAMIVIAIAGFSLMGFFAARRTGSFNTSVLTAVVAAIVSGVVVGVATGWSWVNDSVSRGNGVRWDALFQTQVVQDILTTSVTALIIGIPTGAVGGAIGNLTRRSSLEKLAGSRTVPR